MENKTEIARKIIRKQMDELKEDGVSYKMLGDWKCEIYLSFEKKKLLGKDLFCHSLKFKTNNEFLVLSLNFSNNFPEQVLFFNFNFKGTRN
jgi:hypothetical protein